MKVIINNSSFRQIRLYFFVLSNKIFILFTFKNWDNARRDFRKKTTLIDIGSLNIAEHYWSRTKNYHYTHFWSGCLHPHPPRSHISKCNGCPACFNMDSSLSFSLGKCILRLQKKFKIALGFEWRERWGSGGFVNRTHIQGDLEMPNIAKCQEEGS